MERRKFTREFKLEAVRLIKDRAVRSYSQAELTDVDVAASHWVKRSMRSITSAFASAQVM